MAGSGCKAGRATRLRTAPKATRNQGKDTINVNINARLIDVAATPAG
jgi:hypothetical protein